jgi:hypothetical protein
MWLVVTPVGRGCHAITSPPPSQLTQKENTSSPVLSLNFLLSVWEEVFLPVLASTGSVMRQFHRNIGRELFTKLFSRGMGRSVGDGRAKSSLR